MNQPREVRRILEPRPSTDGAGVRLNRSIGTLDLDHLDPFLLLDEFRSDSADDYMAGFPDHPHRGFETVTYMLAGSMEHRDHAGNQGLLGPGSIQWMTAGRGIIHSEMPQQEAGLMWGFQLWVNLPSRLKMSPPRYQDIPASDVPDVTGGEARVRVLAGEFGGVSGPVRGIATHPTYLDVGIQPDGRFSSPVPPHHNALVYVFEGSGRVGPTGTTLEASRLAVLGDGDGIEVQASAGGMRLLLLAAEPIGEPVARYGPFVMNTEDEIRQAFEDLRRGTFLE